MPPHDPLQDETAADGYPRGNPTFDEAARRAVARLKNDADDADQFLKEMARELRREMTKP